MNAKKPAGNYGEGRLPAMAPLANPYVPFQIEGPVRYEPRKAMVRGTLYPGLDLPFMGMVNQNNLPVTPLSEVQVLAFAVQELHCIWTPIRRTRRRWNSIGSTSSSIRRSPRPMSGRNVR